MGKRNLHFARRLLTLLLLVPAGVFAVGTSPEVHDEDGLRRAAARNQGRYVNPNPGQELRPALAQQFGALVQRLKLNAVIIDQPEKRTALKQLIAAIADPDNRFAGKIPALDSAENLAKFLRDDMQVERGNVDPASMVETVYNEVLREQAGFLRSVNQAEADKKTAAPRLLVGLGNLRGRPDLRKIQFFANDILNTKALTDAVDDLEKFLKERVTGPPPFADFTVAERALIKAEMVSLKDAMNIEGGRDPRSPNQRFAPGGNQVAQGGPPGGSSGGGSPGGSDSGGGGGSKGGGGGGAPGGGGGGSGRAQQQKLEGGEPQEFKYDQNFASKLGEQARKQEVNIATGETVGPRDFPARDIFASVPGTVQDQGAFAQQNAATIAGMGTLLGPNGAPVAPPQFASVINRVKQVAEQGRPVTTGGGAGFSASLPGGFGGKFNAGNVTSGGFGGGGGRFPADFAAAGGPRGGTRGGVSTPGELRPKYVGREGLNEFVRANPGQRVLANPNQPL